MLPFKPRRAWFNAIEPFFTCFAASQKEVWATCAKAAGVTGTGIDIGVKKRATAVGLPNHKLK